MGIFKKKPATPGFCAKCGEPNEFIPVCDRNNPYSGDSGQIAVAGHEPACTNPVCENHKTKKTWQVTRGYAGSLFFVWVGRIKA